MCYLAKLLFTIILDNRDLFVFFPINERFGKENYRIITKLTKNKNWSKLRTKATVEWLKELHTAGNCLRMREVVWNKTRNIIYLIKWEISDSLKNRREFLLIDAKKNLIVSSPQQLMLSKWIHMKESYNHNILRRLLP